MPLSFDQQKKELEKISLQAKKELMECQNTETLFQHHKCYLGKTGLLTEILKSLKKLNLLEERQQLGQLANENRKELEILRKQKQEELNAIQLKERLDQEVYDILRPLPLPCGGVHPITQMQYKMEDIFTSMGFQIMDGPEVESDTYNFGRLNFTEDHPARDMHDTIWTKNGYLMRTHTSAVQVRAMQELTPPFRIIAPGRCFRYEETDASHENTFHQVEGMMVDREVSISHLIYIMKIFLSSIFEQDIKVRLRPGYFPFVEPGFELDISCLICNGKGCQTCKKSAWIELLPCGLVHPKVLQDSNINPRDWSGFAFGLGLDRLVMMRYGVEDIRNFMSGNLRFLEQFQGAPL